MLSIITFLPALVGLILALVPRLSDAIARVAALVTTLVVFGITLVLWGKFTPSAYPNLQFEENYSWIEPLHIRYHVGLDGIALAMVLLTGLLSPMAVLCSWTAVQKQAKGFFIALLCLETGMMGVFCAADLFLFYTFWEVMLLPMALMIGIWGGPRRIYASMKFVLFTMVGSLLMFVAILYCYFASADASGTSTFDIVTLQQTLPAHLLLGTQIWLFAAFGLSFAIKVPMFPFHTWLPDAHVEAPTAGSVILAGVLLKMGAYGFLRFAIPFFPLGAQYFAPTMLALSAIGIVFGSMMSLAQSDMKKLIAYSSVAHLGFCMLGIFSGDLSAAQGGVLQLVNHGISTGALFLCVGVIYERTHKHGLDDFGGLAKTMPVYATLFMIVLLSSVGLPGTNGFVGEFLVLLGTFQNHAVAGAVAGFGVVLGAAYMLKMYRNVFFGKAKAVWADLPEPNLFELATLVPLVVLIFALGVAPNLILGMTEQPVARVVQDLQDNGVENAAHHR